MPVSPETTPLVRAQSENVALWLSIGGIGLIVFGNAIDYVVWKVQVDAMLANIGALFLIIGVLQWFFDRKIRHDFFFAIRQEIVGSNRIAESGICDFYRDSKDVDFKEHFLSSQRLTIGVNYSAKLIDNSIALLSERTVRGLSTTILVVDPNSEAAQFLVSDYQMSEISHGIHKIQQILNNINPDGTLITLLRIKTILRYSFVRFDSRIWIVIGTNGLGRRAVPGFFVSSGSDWFKHFDKDIELLAERI